MTESELCSFQLNYFRTVNHLFMQLIIGFGDSSETLVSAVSLSTFLNVDAGHENSVKVSADEFVSFGICISLSSH